MFGCSSKIFVDFRRDAHFFGCSRTVLVDVRRDSPFSAAPERFSFCFVGTRFFRLLACGFLGALLGLFAGCCCIGDCCWCGCRLRTLPDFDFSICCTCCRQTCLGRAVALLQTLFNAQVATASPVGLQGLPRRHLRLVASVTRVALFDLLRRVHVLSERRSVILARLFFSRAGKLCPFVSFKFSQNNACTRGSNFVC